MLTFNRQVLAEYEKLVEAKKESVSDNLLAGMLDTMDKYKDMTGYLRAWRESVALLEEAVSIVEGKPR